MEIQPIVVPIRFDIQSTVANMGSVCRECLHSRQTSVLLNGEDVTARCLFADSIAGVAVLVKEGPDGYFLTSLDAKDATDPYWGTDGLLQHEMKVGKVELIQREGN